MRLAGLRPHGVIARPCRVVRVLVALVLAVVQPAGAQSVYSVNLPGSVLVFPNIVSSASQDTLIEIANATAASVSVRCFYIDGAEPRTRTEFSLTLTQRQPTHWVVSQGRPDDPSDPPCSTSSSSCSGAGKDPGPIPGRNEFTGELICLQTSPSHAPVFGNALTGQATIRSHGSDDLLQYAAASLRGDPASAASEPLCLGKGCGAPLDGCPKAWILNHLSDTAKESPLAEGSDETEVVLVSCTQNLLSLLLPPSLLILTVTNEYEQRFGGGFFLQGWSRLSLGELGLTRPALGSMYVQSEFLSSSDDSGFFLSATQRRTTAPPASRSASAGIPAHHSGILASKAASITLPPSIGMAP